MYGACLRLAILRFLECCSRRALTWQTARMTTPPLWYFDGQLSQDRQRMAQAHAVLQRVQDEIPPGYVAPGPAKDRLDRARAEACAAERLFAQRFLELDDGAA